VDASLQKWDYPIPKTGTGTIAAGSLYKIKITDLTAPNTAINDYSDQPFKINAGGSSSTLNISSTPGDAWIYIDGVLQGQHTTPQGQKFSNIAPGTHTVTVNLTQSGSPPVYYADQSKVILLTQNTNTPAFPVSFTLETLGTNSRSGLPNLPEDTGKRVVTSEPSGAEVWIDGSMKGLTPYEEQIVPGTDWTQYPKKSTVEVRRSGITLGTQEMLVGKGWTAIADFPLDPSINLPPEIGEILVPAAPDFVDNIEVKVSAIVTDPNVDDTYDTLQGIWTWTDPETQTSWTSPASFYSDGLVTGSYTFRAAGIYKVKLTVTDKRGLSATRESLNYVAVADPSAGYVIGAGSIDSPVGAYADDPFAGGKAYFGFTSRYYKGKTVPQGITDFYYETRNMNFYSTSYEWLIVDGAKATYKGTGKICGKSGEYKFVLSAVDGAYKTGNSDRFDKFRIRITDKTTGVRIYDNQLDQPDEAEPTTVLKHGFIIINKNK
jgi:hypothetical protein